MLISIVKLEKENKYLGNLILYFCWGGNCLLKSLSMFIHVDCSVLSSFTLYQIVCTYNYNTYGEGKWVFLPLTALIGRGKHYCCLSWQCNVDIDIVITKTSQQDVCSAAGREITTSIWSDNWERVGCVFVFVDIANNHHHLHHTLDCEQPNRSDAIIHRAGTCLSRHWLNGKQDRSHWFRLFAA